jgi:hypothetical protein
MAKIFDYEEDVSYLKVTDFENFFNIYEDTYRLNNKVYNLNSTLYLDIDESSLTDYQLTHDLQWSLISYNVYGTTRLTWLLWKINNVKPNRVLETVRAGTTVKVLPMNKVQDIVMNINDYS